MNNLGNAPALETRLMLSNIAARTATFNGSAFDVSDYEGVLAVSQIVGSISGTPTLDGKVETDDGGGSWVTVKNTAGADATFTQVTTSNSLQTQFIDKRACEKNIRYTGTIGGGSPSLTMGVLLAAVKKYIG